MRERWKVVHFEAMGSACSVEVLGRHAQARIMIARRRLAELEQLWSRFLPSSDVSSINSAAGQAVRVSPTTVALIRLAVDGWEATRGLFCPFAERVLAHHGYAETFASIRERRPGQSASPTFPPVGTPGPLMDLLPIDIDERSNTVSVAPGFGVDLGGVAKGFAADLVTDELIADGAKAATVNLGGDLAFRSANNDIVWRIDAEHPDIPGSTVASIDVSSGGVATSSVRRRCWRTGDGTLAHHLIDPRTSEPAASDVIGCSIAADRCAHAEVLTKVVVCDGLAAGEALAHASIPDVLLISAGGRVRRFGGWVCP